MHDLLCHSINIVVAAILKLVSTLMIQFHQLCIYCMSGTFVRLCWQQLQCMLCNLVKANDNTSHRFDS